MSPGTQGRSLQRSIPHFARGLRDCKTSFTKSTLNSQCGSSDLQHCGRPVTSNERHRKEVENPDCRRTCCSFSFITFLCKGRRTPEPPSSPVSPSSYFCLPFTIKLHRCFHFLDAHKICVVHAMVHTVSYRCSVIHGTWPFY